MDVLVAGGHGQVALRLLKLLAERGDSARGIIRNPEHASELEAVGALPVVCDLESVDSLADVVAGADAVVFAAGAGAGSGPERKRTVDYGAAVKLIEACVDTGVNRYLMVSSIGAHDPEGGPEAMRPYLRAKAEADAALMSSGLEWTIVRPGSLKDDPGTGQVTVTADLAARGPVARDDVAATLLACLDDPEGTSHTTFVLLDGDVPILEALAALE